MFNQNIKRKDFNNLFGRKFTTRHKVAYIRLVIGLIPIFLMILLSSCITVNLNSVKGLGEVVSKDFEVSDFNELIFTGIGEINIEQGETESLTVEAQQGIIENLFIRSEEEILEIGYKSGFINILPTKKIKFYLKVRDLNKIEISGAGKIKCDKFATDSLTISSSGAGSIEMDVDVDELEVVISGAGRTELSGRANDQKITISGVGSYDAKGLESKNCKIVISGTGKATVNVSETLDINMSGIGSINYIGNPSVTQSVTTGGGTIRRIE